MNKDIAHVLQQADSTWARPHYLVDHLNCVAALAGSFSSKFDSTEWGKAAGNLHDIGKGRPEWQKYLLANTGFDEEAHLEGIPGKIPHAIYGAIAAEDLYGKAAGRLIAYCISGHHAGLPDWSSANGAGQSSLQYQKLKHSIEENALEAYLRSPQNVNYLNIPWKFKPGLDCSLWVRMLFSCLVDADFLDTEEYMQSEIGRIRSNFCSIAELKKRFDIYMSELGKNSEVQGINNVRRAILQKCIIKADDDQGAFSLSVPTGGGKTLSSLAFGLNHSIAHNLKRIIYVIPYTSIIEQNAEVFRNVLGIDQVVEHHSNINSEENNPQMRLASENWDAPIIVTTTVQFFESLFASKPGRCRKLHNICESVVILDEAQLVPVELLAPILHTMQLLIDHYKVTLLISTATKPAFHNHSINGAKFKGLNDIKEIVGSDIDVQELYSKLKRSNIIMPDDMDSAVKLEDIAEQLIQHEQVLCVVSDRKSCKELYDLMPRGTYHLSALMCGQHRSNKIREIKEKLAAKQPIRVISTQLIEAGVDVDFPVVYRSMAGIDSIVQAAGRCNREGKSSEPGRVFVFNLPRKPPAGILRKTTDTTRSILGNNNEDLLNPMLYEKYFEELYWKAHSLDSNNIIGLLDPMQNDVSELSIFFRTAASRFALIDDSAQITIIVDYGVSKDIIREIRENGIDRLAMRKLQRYCVNIYRYQFSEMLERGDIEEVAPDIFLLATPLLYSDDTGLQLDGVSFNPEQFIL